MQVISVMAQFAHPNELTEVIRELVACGLIQSAQSLATMRTNMKIFSEIYDRLVLKTHLLSFSKWSKQERINYKQGVRSFCAVHSDELFRNAQPKMILLEHSKAPISSDAPVKNSNVTNTVSLFELSTEDPNFIKVEAEMQGTIRGHKGGAMFRRYDVRRIQMISNQRLWERFEARRTEVFQDNKGSANVKFLWHGSPNTLSIINNGFDVRMARPGMFGAGIYFADISSKSNQYVLGPGKNTCFAHSDQTCEYCDRQLLLCLVAVGKSVAHKNAIETSHAPVGAHSVMGQTSPSGLQYPEYVMYNSDQAYPMYLITYRLVKL